MSTTRRVEISYGHRGRKAIRVSQEEISTRFHDIKDDLQDRQDIEVTNGFVLSVLFDVYWLHAEGEEPA